MSPDTKSFNKNYKDWVRAIQFELLTPKVKKAYVGIKLDTLLHNDLQKCRQTVVVNGSFVDFTADEFYEKFLVRMATINDITHTDMAAVFFNNHTETNRLSIEAVNNWQLPPRRGMNESLDEAYARVATVHEFAVLAERGINASVRAVQRLTGARHQTRSFASVPRLSAFSG